MRLRLYHHSDGARVAYRESGTGRPLVLLHSLGLSYREFEPIVDALAARFRVVLPDLPLHGDSEDRPRHPYTTDWFVDVVAGFCNEVAGPRAALVGHDFGAGIALRAVAADRYVPERLVLMNNRLEHAARKPGRRAAWRAITALGAVPGVDLALSYGTRVVFRPRLGERLSAQANPEARDAVRHAFLDVPGNASRARAWAKFARRRDAGPRPGLLAACAERDLPVLLLWAEADRDTPLSLAQDALDVLPRAQLRTLPDAGFLVAYDDAVNLARELISFCG